MYKCIFVLGFKMSFRKNGKGQQTWNRGCKEILMTYRYSIVTLWTGNEKYFAKTYYLQFIISLAMYNNAIISDNCLFFFILYQCLLSSETIDCICFEKGLQFKHIFTDIVLHFVSITQHPGN